MSTDALSLFLHKSLSLNTKTQQYKFLFILFIIKCFCSPSHFEMTLGGLGAANFELKKYYLLGTFASSVQLFHLIQVSINHMDSI